MRFQRCGGRNAPDGNSLPSDLLTTNAPGAPKSVLYRNDCMAILPLSLSPGAAARALLQHLLEHGDIVGRDTIGRTIIQLALDDWVLDLPGARHR